MYVCVRVRARVRVCVLSPVDEIRKAPKSSQSNGVGETSHQEIPFVVPGHPVRFLIINVFYHHRHCHRAPLDKIHC